MAKVTITIEDAGSDIPKVNARFEPGVNLGGEVDSTPALDLASKLLDVIVREGRLITRSVLAADMSKANEPTNSPQPGTGDKSDA